MKIKKHQPLLLFVADEVHRFVVSKKTGKYLSKQIGCYRDYNKPCSFKCCALCVFEYAGGLHGLHCSAAKVPIGILDPERTDLDYLDVLKFGTELQEAIIADEKNRK